MDAAGISKTLDSVMSSPGIIGSMIIDSSTGLCLGARGKATEDDATYLTIASRKALNGSSVGAVTHKDWFYYDEEITESLLRSTKIQTARMMFRAHYRVMRDQEDVLSEAHESSSSKAVWCVLLHASTNKPKWKLPRSEWEEEYKKLFSRTRPV